MSYARICQMQDETIEFIRVNIKEIALHIDLLREQVLKPKQSSTDSSTDSLMLEIINKIEMKSSLLYTQLNTESRLSVLLRSVDDPIESLVIIELMKDQIKYLRDQITKPEQYENNMSATLSEIQKENDNLRNQLPIPESSEDDDPN